MADDGALAGSLGKLIGTGPGRGLALFFAVIGAFVVVASALAWTYGPLRHLERDVPDAVEAAQRGDTQPEPV
jgi:hypothetical protein